MQSYSKQMRRHDETVTTTTKTVMTKSEIAILLRYNQNENEFQGSMQNYANARRCTHLCYKLYSQQDKSGATDLAAAPLVKLEHDEKTGTTTLVKPSSDEAKQATSFAKQNNISTLTPLERKIKQRDVYYLDPGTGKRESEAAAKLRWTFFKALEAATPYHRHKVYAPGDVHGLLEAVCRKVHYGITALFENMLALCTRVTYNPRSGIDVMLDQCRTVKKKANEMSCADVFSDRLMAGAVLHALLKSGGEKWQSEVTNIQRVYESTKVVPSFDQLSLQLHTHEENLRISTAKQAPRAKPPLTALYTPAPQDKGKGRAKGKGKPKVKGKSKSKKNDSPVECFNCKGPHYIRDCPKMKNHANLALPVDASDKHALMSHRHYANMVRHRNGRAKIASYLRRRTPTTNPFIATQATSTPVREEEEAKGEAESPRQQTPRSAQSVPTESQSPRARGEEVSSSESESSEVNVAEQDEPVMCADCKKIMPQQGCHTHGKCRDN